MTTKKKTETSANTQAQESNNVAYTGQNTVVPQGFKFVSRVAYGDETVSEEPLKVPNFEGPVGYVRGGAKFTKNLGNYQSATVSIEVELPCYPVHEEVVRVSDQINELIGELLNEQVNALG